MAEIVSMPGAAPAPPDEEKVRTAWMSAVELAIAGGATEKGVIAYESASGEVGIEEAAGTTPAHAEGILMGALRRLREGDTDE